MFEIELDNVIKNYKINKKWNSNSTLLFAKKGKLNCLIFALHFDCEFNPETTNIAYQYKQYKILEYIFSKNLYIHPFTIEMCLQSTDKKMIDLFIKYNLFNEIQTKKVLKNYYNHKSHLFNESEFKNNGC